MANERLRLTQIGRYVSLGRQPPSHGNTGTEYGVLGAYSVYCMNAFLQLATPPAANLPREVKNLTHQIQRMKACGL